MYVSYLKGFKNHCQYTSLFFSASGPNRTEKQFQQTNNTHTHTHGKNGIHAKLISILYSFYCVNWQQRFEATNYGLFVLATLIQTKPAINSEKNKLIIENTANEKKNTQTTTMFTHTHYWNNKRIWAARERKKKRMLTVFIFKNNTKKHCIISQMIHNNKRNRNET